MLETLPPLVLYALVAVVGLFEDAVHEKGIHRDNKMSSV
jgi:hypothetical protein